MESMSIDVLKKLFTRHFHSAPTRIQPLQGELGGSGRKIIRLTNERVSAVGILYGGREENTAFLEFLKHFRRYCLPVPEIYAEDLNHGAYLEEDLGDTSLFEFLSRNRSGDDIAPAVVDAYRKSVGVLPRFQVEAARDFDYSFCYPIASFDRQSIAWDLNYCKYYFLRLAGIPFNDRALETDFDRLTDFLLEAPRDYFLYRDFQSRNIMLRDGLPYFVYYQGGRKGALQYDIASLLFDAKADLPPDLREHLLYDYLRALATFVPVDREDFLRYYYPYVYVRIMQALGAYGYRGFFERRAHFLQSVPYALKNIRWLLHNAQLPIELPTLLGAFQSMLASEKLQSIAFEPDNLVVRIFSFSFHNALPNDKAGNSGGSAFDCAGRTTTPSVACRTRVFCARGFALRFSVFFCAQPLIAHPSRSRQQSFRAKRAGFFLAGSLLRTGRPAERGISLRFFSLTLRSLRVCVSFSLLPSPLCGNPFLFSSLAARHSPLAL